jgi:hypothetical protein
MDIGFRGRHERAWWVGAGLLLAVAWWLAAASVQAKPATVVVPRVHEDVVAAYNRLHALGLRVSIPQGMAFNSLAPPQVAWMIPRAGRRIPRGSTARPARTGNSIATRFPDWWAPT